MKKDLLKPLRWRSGKFYHNMLQKLGEKGFQAWLDRSMLDRQTVDKDIQYYLDRPDGDKEE